MSDLRRAVPVEALMARVEALAGASAETRELLRALTTLYGEGLRRIVEAVAEKAAADGVLESLCVDPFVASLLLAHDLHPVPLATRIERALDKSRPYIHSHGGEVEVARIEGGVVELRLSGTCDGCPASAATMKLNVERAIREAAPEIVEVRAS